MENKSSTKNGVKRLVFVVIAILLEVLINVALVIFLGVYQEWIMILLHIAAAALVLYIYNEDKTASIKMPWIILVMAMPVLGLTLYLLIGLNPGMSSMRKRYEEIDKDLLPLMPDKRSDIDELSKKDRRAGNIARYILDRSSYPTYKDTDIVYFAEATDGIETQKKELKKAQKFIFMEYHAIENAESWKAIEDVLVDRVKAGVEVRVFYDDMGSIGFINTDFVKLLESKGIRCRVFNPFKIGLNLFLNNRDHRKITVIDGKVGFTGGYNIANEYFNITHPFGYWKDTGIMVRGEVVKSLTVAFLEMWNAIRGDDENDTDYKQYLPDVENVEEISPEYNWSKGFVSPYADIPLDKEQTGEEVYISIAEYAKTYAWYITPYLILTDEMVHALGLAAKRGVDVRVITPGIPDKALVYSITRSYYHSLVRNGVKIYEYTPGFCHCKMSIADDMLATCGTINLDYRSLYHHFENGCLYADCQAVLDTKADFESIMKESREVTQDYLEPTAGKKLLQMILRLAAPLM